MWIQIGKEEINLPLFADSMILYIKDSKEYNENLEHWRKILSMILEARKTSHAYGLEGSVL